MAERVNRVSDVRYKMKAFIEFLTKLWNHAASPLRIAWYWARYREQVCTGSGVQEIVCQMGSKIFAEGDESTKKSNLRRIVGVVLARGGEIHAEYRNGG